MKRRIANRESARRVRQKRQDQIEVLTVKVGSSLDSCADNYPCVVLALPHTHTDSTHRQCDSVEVSNCVQALQ